MPRSAPKKSSAMSLTSGARAERYCSPSSVKAARSAAKAAFAPDWRLLPRLRKNSAGHAQPVIVLRVQPQKPEERGKAIHDSPAHLGGIRLAQQGVAPDEAERQHQQKDQEEVGFSFSGSAHQSLYSNIKSYMLTVSPSFTPISSIRWKTPASRSTRSKYIRLS